MEAWVLANSVAHDDEMAASWPLYRLASVNGEVLDARPPDAFLRNLVALRWHGILCGILVILFIFQRHRHKEG